MMEGELTALASGVFAIGGNVAVTRLGYGAMRITGRGIWGEPADRAEAVRVLRQAVDLGVDFIDTADSYGPYVSEELIREALYPYDGVTIATKGGLTRSGPDRWGQSAGPSTSGSAWTSSLRRLGLDSIDLYQLHRIDPMVPAADQVGALHELRKEGKIRHIGLSEVSVADIGEARLTAPIATVQNVYNLLDRRHEPVLDYCEREGLGFMPVLPDRDRAARQPGRAAGPAGQAVRLQPGPAGAGLAAAPVPGHAADPGYRVGRAPGGERGRRAGRADRRAVHRHVRPGP